MLRHGDAHFHWPGTYSVCCLARKVADAVVDDWTVGEAGYDGPSQAVMVVVADGLRFTPCSSTVVVLDRHKVAHSVTGVGVLLELPSRRFKRVNRRHLAFYNPGVRTPVNSSQALQYTRDAGPSKPMKCVGSRV